MNWTRKMNSPSCTIGLAAVVLAVASPRASAGIVLDNREACVGASVAVVEGGVTIGGDFPSPKCQFDFLAVNLSNSAMASGATASSSAGSSITLDPLAGTLQFTFDGGASTAGRSDPEESTTECVGDSSDQLSFNLTDVPYTYTVTGALSGTSVGGTGQGTALVELSGTFFSVSFLINGDRMDSQPVSMSGTLDPGSYTIDIRTQSSLTSAAGGSASVNANIILTVRPAGSPPPAIQWTNAAGGSFQTATNWDPQMVPGASDTALFGLASLYSVDVGTATTDRLEIRNGGVTFTNTNYTVTAGGPAPPSILLDDNALLTLASGSLSGVEGVIGQNGAAGVDVQSGATLSLLTLRVGGTGDGILDIASGGSVFSSQSLIGNGVGFGQVGVDGLNAIFDSGTLIIGSLGDGFLGVSNGALVTSADGRVGSAPDHGGLATIGDAGSRWALSEELIIQQGIVSAQGGGVVDAQDSIDIGIEPSQAAQLQMLNGGLVQTPNCTVWGGLLEVDGQATTSSRLDVTDLLSLGGLLDPASTSTSSVESAISGGGTVVAQRVALGDRDGISSATLTISGVGSNGQASLLNVAGANPEFLVSGAPGTLLEVKDGGMLSTSSITSYIGSGLLIGKVLIHGKSGSLPSTWAMADDFLNIGSQVVPSELVVEEGGVVTGDVATFLGNDDRELGRMTIAGDESSFTTGVLRVGEKGDGVLTISGGAHCDAGPCRVGAPAVPARGTGLATIRGTLLESSEWQVTTFTVGDTEPGTLRLEGETIGLFDVGGATLRADDTVTIGLKGFVRGNGTIVSPKVVGTNISPDVDIEAPVRGSAVLTAPPAGKSGLPSASAAGGIIMIEGDYEQPADGKLTIDAIGVAAGEFDVLHVTGNATLAGTLEMLFPGTYLPKAGDSWQFLMVDGTISGEFAEVTFPQLLPGFQFDTAQVAGGLLFTALNDAVLAPTFLLNISTRLQVETGDNVLIGGFILQGMEPKRVLIRAVGPSLEKAGVSGALANPTLELHDGTGALIGQNDDWRDTQTGGLITEDQFFEIFATGIPPTSFEESAIVATLEPGAYTAIIAGADGSTGIGLAEVYDLGPAAVPAKLANISTRGFVQTGDNVMIGGFIVGNQTSQVLVRGIGPSLAAFEVKNVLADPMLELHDVNGALLASNDNWRSDQETEIEATTIPPNDDLESAILRTLAPGAYTAILRGVSESTGVGLVEAYNLD